MENPARTKPTPPEDTPSDTSSDPSATPPEDPIRLDGWIAPAIATVAAVILSYAALMVVLFAFMGSGDCDVYDGCSWAPQPPATSWGPPSARFRT